MSKCWSFQRDAVCIFIDGASALKIRYIEIIIINVLNKNRNILLLSHPILIQEIGDIDRLEGIDRTNYPPRTNLRLCPLERGDSRLYS